MKKQFLRGIAFLCALCLTITCMSTVAIAFVNGPTCIEQDGGKMRITNVGEWQYLYAEFKNDLDTGKRYRREKHFRYVTYTCTVNSSHKERLEEYRYTDWEFFSNLW